MIVSSTIPTRKHGKVSVCPNPWVHGDGDKGIGRSPELKKAKTLCVSSGDSSTFGLATRKFVVNSLADHNSDPFAHEAALKALADRVRSLEKEVLLLRKMLAGVTK